MAHGVRGGKGHQNVLKQPANGNGHKKKGEPRYKARVDVIDASIKADRARLEAARPT